MYDKKVLPDMTGARADASISLVRFDPAKELEILRSVVLRDALVALLADQRRKVMTGEELCFKTLLKALVEVREASLEVTEAVTRWRFTLVKPEEFTVRGSNYVATMATDMTFLATGLTPLKEKFGMEFGTGNPFALPCMISSTAAASVSKTVGEGVIAVAGGASAKSQVGRRKESPTRVARRISKATPGRPGATRPDKASKHGVSRRALREHSATGTSSCDEDRGLKGSACAQGGPQQLREKDPNTSVEEGDGGEQELRQALHTLGDMDDAQRKRVVRAQIFLEAEVARQGAARSLERLLGGVFTAGTPDRGLPIRNHPPDSAFCQDRFITPLPRACFSADGSLGGIRVDVARVEISNVMSNEPLL